MERKYQVLALDLEGTLISNGVSQIPRPGLLSFLTACAHRFPRIVLFTTVPQPRFRSIAAMLCQDGFAPHWFPDMEYVEWSGPTKDLRYIRCVREGDVLLIDDCSDYVYPGQQSQWIQIPLFEAPYNEESDWVFRDIVARIDIVNAYARTRSVF